MAQHLGGWAIDKEVYDYIRSTLSVGSTILELGSGAGTGALAEHYTMYSIEHDMRWVGRFPSSYIFAPMNGKWYDVAAVREKLPDQYDLILIDGPIGSESDGRIGFLHNIDLFNTTVPMIFDDTNRPGERRTFEAVLAYLHQTQGHRDHKIFERFSIIL
jgi:hypothetical protein